MTSPDYHRLGRAAKGIEWLLRHMYESPSERILTFSASMLEQFADDVDVKRDLRDALEFLWAQRAQLRQEPKEPRHD